MAESQNPVTLMDKGMAVMVLLGTATVHTLAAVAVAAAKETQQDPVELVVEETVELMLIPQVLARLVRAAEAAEYRLRAMLPMVVLVA